MQLIQMSVMYRRKNIENKTHILYLEAKLVESSIVITTYANITKFTVNNNLKPRDNPLRDDKPNKRT